MILGISLAGGGVKGIAHAGVLRAFEEAGINTGCISRDFFWEYNSESLCCGI